MEGKDAQYAKALVAQGLRSSLMGIGMNFALAVLKCTAGVVGHSFALIADGIESMSDVLSSTVVYCGLKYSLKPPDREHPYGHGKAEPVAAIIVSLALVIAAILIGVEAIQEIRTPHRMPEPYTLWVLLAVVAIKLILSRYVSQVGETIGSTAVRTDAWHHMSDAITSAFAFVGIAIALFTKNPAADDWAALCASPIILFNACRQFRQPFAEILDASPDPQTERSIRSAAANHPKVIGLEKCHVRKVGFRFYVDLHVVVNGALSVREGHRIAHDVEAHILESIPQVAAVLVHIEPEEELFAHPFLSKP